MAIMHASKAFVLGSNPSSPAKLWNYSKGVITPPCHGEVTSSSLVSSAKCIG